MLRKRMTQPALLLLGLLAASPAPGTTVNRILATIDGEPVTLYELQQFSERNPAIRQLPTTDRDALLDALIIERVIQKEVSDKGIVVRDEDVDRYVDDVKQRNQINDEQLRAALEQQGVGWEEYRTQIRNDLQKVYLINREIRGKVNVTPEEVERYYQAHLAEYATESQVTVSHILFRLPRDAAPEQADAVLRRSEEIYEQLRNGADFAELARQYSEDPAAESGGKLGSFKQGEMLDEMEEAVNALKPGEFTRPFRTDIGVQIVRLDERTSGGHQPLESLAEGIKEQLYNAALEERYNRWLSEDLRESHHVELLP